MELHDVTAAFRAGARDKLQIEGNVQALVAPGAAGYSRKQLDELDGEREVGGRARRLYREGDGGRDHSATGEKLIGADGVKKLAEALRREDRAI